MTFSNRNFTLALLAALSGCLGAAAPKVAGQLPDGTVPSTYYVDSLSAGGVTTVAYDDWGFPKSRLFNFTACLKDNAGLNSITDQHFSVSDGTQKIAVKTDLRGCIQWNESHAFNYLAPETYLPVKRTITAEELHQGSVELTLQINPWTGAMVDPRFERQPVLAAGDGRFSFSAPLTVEGAEEASMEVKALGMQFLGLRYEQYTINPMLSLSIAQSYRMRLSPTFYRHTIGRENSGESPVKGRLRLTALLLRENESLALADRYLASFEEEVEIVNGEAIKDIVMSFPDVAAASARNTLIVEVTPVTKNSGVKAVRVMGPLAALPPPGLPLVPSTLSASQLRNEVLALMAHKSPEGVRPLEIFAQKSGLKALDVGSLPASASDDLTLSRADLSRMIDGKTDKTVQAAVLRKLCVTVYGRKGITAPARGLAAWFHKNPTGAARGAQETDVDYCLRRPLALMNVALKRFVEELHNPTPVRKGLQQNEAITLTTSIMRGTSESTARGTQDNFKFSLSANAGLDLGLSDSLGLGPAKLTPSMGLGASLGWGRDWYQTRVSEKRSGRSEMIMDGITLVLATESNAFEVDSTSRRCLLVAPRDAKSVFTGLYACSEKTVRGKSLETFYYVSQVTGNSHSPWSDPDSATEFPWRLFIRGSGTYADFKDLVTKTKTQVLLESAIKPGAPDWMLSIDPHLTQDFPGMLSDEGFQPTNFITN